MHNDADDTVAEVPELEATRRATHNRSGRPFPIGGWTMSSREPTAEEIVSRVKIQARIRDAVVAQMAEQTTEELSAIAGETSGDTIYAIDRVSEDLIRELFAEAFKDTTIVVVGEGLADAGEVFPEGKSAEDASYRMIVDPIDGTRGLMYDKRSAWVLTGVAANRGADTCLADIFAAVQTEIPTSKQYRADVLSAIRAKGRKPLVSMSFGVSKFRFSSPLQSPTRSNTALQ